MLDRLAQEQLVTSDEEQRADVLAGMQRIVARDVPVLRLYYPTLYTAFAWTSSTRGYFTPGGFAGGLPGVHNKQVLIRG